jgi:hypothetical protein
MNFIIDKTELKPGLIIFRRGDATSASRPGAAAAGRRSWDPPSMSADTISDKPSMAA